VKKDVKSKAVARNGCDGRLKTKILIMKTQGICVLEKATQIRLDCHP